jgi:hypothetical protein
MIRRLMIKSILLSVVFLFAIGLCGNAQAQIITPYDTLYLDTPFLVNGVDYPALMTGRPDSTPAHFSGDAYSASRMTPWLGGPGITMAKGNTLVIYYFIPSSAQPTDSILGRLRLQSLDENFVLGEETDIIFREPGPKELEHEINITIPDTGFNAIGLEVATDSGGNSLWIDAVVMVQSGLASVAEAGQSYAPLLASYPNPFYRSDGTTLRVTSNAPGYGLLRIYDVLGNEVTQVPVGELTEGEQNVKIALDRAGIFFARLFVNGSPSGAPLKITSE